MSNGMSAVQMKQILEHASASTGGQDTVEPLGTSTNNPITGEPIIPVYSQMIPQYQKLVPLVIAFLIFRWCFK